jgi:hypothetical protein
MGGQPICVQLPVEHGAVNVLAGIYDWLINPMIIGDEMNPTGHRLGIRNNN